MREKRSGKGKQKRGRRRVRLLQSKDEMRAKEDPSRNVRYLWFVTWFSVPRVHLAAIGEDPLEWQQRFSTSQVNTRPTRLSLRQLGRWLFNYDLWTTVLIITRHFKWRQTFFSINFLADLGFEPLTLWSADCQSAIWAKETWFFSILVYIVTISHI